MNLPAPIAQRPICPIIIGLSGHAITAAERALLERLNPAGVILFSRNIKDKAQLTEYIHTIHEILPRTAGAPPLLIALDNEGGRVQRLRWHLPQTPSAAAYGALYDPAPELALEAVRLHSFLLATEMAELGFNLNFAPAADVAAAADIAGRGYMGDRTFHAQPNVVAAACGSAISGSLAGGVWPCLKHAPGHGLALTDSHQAPPQVEAAEKRLCEQLIPFQQNAACPFMMTAHAVYTAWDSIQPASQSAAIHTTILRGEIGFTGTIIADDVCMNALVGTLLQRAKACLGAGADLTIVSFSKMTEGQGIFGGFDESAWQQAAELSKLPPLSPSAAAKLQALPALPITPPPHATLAAAKVRFDEICLEIEI